ncbi:MAG: chemotaxis-specific protein-glutamate methyltransferase CheB [Treponema sp.]|nr:chemotaxis-specific protein-glutamate methyltransferase CheB [Treponema sp.]
MINTLIVDENIIVRKALKDFLEADGSFNIIGEAADGEEGLQKILSLNPDLVTLDIEMPKMNGFEVIEEAMKKTCIPIVIITSNDTAKNAYEASVRGALEFFSKDFFLNNNCPEKRQSIYDTLKRISSVKAQKNTNTVIDWSELVEDADISVPDSLKTQGERKINAVVIASSTGGPKALSRFFTLLPGDFFPPIVIVQHNSSGFDKGFARWLDAFTALNVKVADEGDILQTGTVYIAQTDKHLELRRLNGQELCLRYNDNKPEHNQKPAADVLFRTAAETLKKSLISVVFTGMGNDGADGTKKVREMGGITLAQDEKSSLVYGMPKAAAETGCVDMVLPLDKISEMLVKLVQPEGTQ